MGRRSIVDVAWSIIDESRYIAEMRSVNKILAIELEQVVAVDLVLLHIS